MSTKLSHWVFGAVVVALAIGYIIGQSLPDYKHTIHRQIFADNLTTSTLYFFIALVYWRRWNGHQSDFTVDRWWTQLGAIGTFSTWAIHRMYWGTWRHFLDSGDADMATWWRDNLSPLTSFLQLSIWVFALVMVWPSAQRILGPNRWWVAFLSIPTIWIFWFGLETVF